MVINCGFRGYKLYINGKVLHYASREARDADAEFYRKAGFTCASRKAA